MKIRRLGKIEQTYRHFRRFEEIIKIIFKYGLENIIEGLELPQALEGLVQSISGQRQEEIRKLSRGQRVRNALEELGPTFVKMGQILSMRVELLPSDIIEELQFLQDHVTPDPVEEIRETIREELGMPVEEIFSSFQDEPLGSASLGQVHAAKLKNGRPVAVKVQRKDIHRQVEQDMEILMHLAEFMERHIDEVAPHRPTEVLEEFSFSLEKEMDYLQEASHIRRFRAMFAEDPNVFIMDTFADYTTEKVLTMELVDGIRASEVKRIEAGHLDRSLIAGRGVDAVLTQIFREGFFHADPHAGNIFVLQDNVVSFIDFGMVGRLSRHRRELMAAFLMEVSRRNPERSVRVLLKMTDYDHEPSRHHLERGMGDLIDRYVSRELKDIKFDKLLYQLSELLTRHKLRLPVDYSMMLKAMTTLEGLGRSLDPTINLTEHMLPYFHRLRAEHWKPSHVSEDLFDTLEDVFTLLKDLPDQFQKLIRQAQRGKSTINVEHRSAEEFQTFVNRVSNRLSYSIILAAIMIASALIVQSGVPPLYKDIPLIGLIGFVLAGVMSLRLLIAIWKSGMF